MIPSLSLLASYKPAAGGGGGAPVKLADRTISAIFGDPASASYTLNSNGYAYNHTGATLEQWMLSGVASNYEVRATVANGVAPTGTVGSWLALTSNRTWGLSQSGVGSKTSELLVEIRNSSSLVVLDSATIILSVSVSGGGGDI